MLKRTLDIFISIFLLVVLSPVMLLIAWCVNQYLGTPILFKQIRPGLHHKSFNMIKFRTMLDVTKAPHLSDEERITRFGRFLRKTSLDELPELWNVLKGEMSLVGPRPLLTEYLPLYTEEQARRHDVRPGMTGWAQVNGRNALTWEEKFVLDVWYVDNQSFKLDIKILLLTFTCVLKREGIDASSGALMPMFLGERVDEHKDNV
jgi:lipopolysaccharide/colanic/teichoic acid biosynthesis glycosyltransferase